MQSITDFIPFYPPPLYVAKLNHWSVVMLTNTYLYGEVSAKIKEKTLSTLDICYLMSKPKITLSAVMSHKWSSDKI